MWVLIILHHFPSNYQRAPDQTLQRRRDTESSSHVWPCTVHLKILNGLSIDSSYYYSKDM